jgi:hypothetical protein
MRKLIAFFAFILSLHSAIAKEGGSVLKGLAKYNRVGYSYGEGRIEDLNPAAIERLPYFKSFGAETDFIFPLSIHVAFRETLTQDATIAFNGATSVRGEIYATTMDLGLKLAAPIPFFQPWIGAGYTAGIASISNPKTRNSDGAGVIWENETHNIWGNYWQAGIDFMFDENFGIRAGYQEDRFETDKYLNLGFQEVKFVQKRFYGSIVANL